MGFDKPGHLPYPPHALAVSWHLYPPAFWNTSALFPLLHALPKYQRTNPCWKGVETAACRTIGVLFKYTTALKSMSCLFERMHLLPFFIIFSIHLGPRSRIAGLLFPECFQLFLGIPEAFTGQMRYGPSSWFRVHPGASDFGCAHPNQIPGPPQLNPLDAKKHRPPPISLKLTELILSTCIIGSFTTRRSWPQARVCKLMDWWIESFAFRFSSLCSTTVRITTLASPLMPNRTAPLCPHSRTGPRETAPQWLTPDAEAQRTVSLQTWKYCLSFK